MMQQAVGVDIGGTKMLLYAEVAGSPVERQVATGYDCTPAKLKAAIDAFLAELPYPPSSLGVAIPGLVAGDDRVVISNVMPALAGLEASLFGPSVRFINDVSAALVHEAANLAPGGVAAVIMVGTGIGMGIWANGGILAGAKGWAGELGSIPLPTAAGVRTLDEVASGAGILRAFGASAPELQEALERGDGAATALVTLAGEAFGHGLATVINLLNPELIVLGGGTLNYPGYYEAAIRSAEAGALADLWSACTVRRASDPRRMVALGARRFGAMAD